ncbi:ArsR/SmtB family transcription factor [Nitrosopumilus ureiphilus]|uniref:ArsR family transcriptional regulator n=1 Tax=Nitrosopumilus ureiphilus TaxID=1470067 RepID=A0A7D5RC87_9ARCH|nr:winged helix-turn-helix domain-containing protein [Nitrosopumilus ureiphilus]QLH07844.1 ArsR family transcriptional regulator [Nitrosopumilus ureiphilus]
MSDENFETVNAVNIFSLDDVKMKILAKVISNKSSIEILNLLFRNEMTANEIAQKTNMSLQLVKYYLEKMQQIDLVQISKTEKNSKARDMNYYKTSKLAIIITPSKITEKTKQSKLLVRSFNSISKFFAMGLVSAITALSLVMVSAESRLLDPLKSWYSEFSLPVKISGTGLVNSVDESLYMAKTKVDAVVSNPGAGSGTPYFDPYSSILDFTGSDFTITMIVLAGIGAVISFAIFNRVIKTFQKCTLDDSFQKI